MNTAHIILLAHIALGFSFLSLVGSAYAIFRATRAITTNHVALARAQESAASAGSALVVNCTTCCSSVVRYSLTSKGPVCANCKPLK